jgi:hypothetical protein
MASRHNPDRVEIIIEFAFVVSGTRAAPARVRRSATRSRTEPGEVRCWRRTSGGDAGHHRLRTVGASQPSRSTSDRGVAAWRRRCISRREVARAMICTSLVNFSSRTAPALRAAGPGIAPALPSRARRTAASGARRKLTARASAHRGDRHYPRRAQATRCESRLCRYSCRPSESHFAVGGDRSAVMDTRWGTRAPGRRAPAQPAPAAAGGAGRPSSPARPRLGNQAFVRSATSY